MTTSQASAKTSKATASKAAPAAKKTATRSTAAKSSTEPSLRFHHSKALRVRSDAVLAALEASPDEAHHRVAVADLVADLVDAGMDYYFLRALHLAEVGFIKEQSARLGISGAAKLINSVSRKFIVSMDSKQLLAVASHMRSLA